MTEDEFRQVCLSFPHTEEGVSYGRPSFKTRGKFLTRIRAEDASAVFVNVPFDEREFLMEADPETFHLTPHYKDYPSVLARLSGLTAEQARGFIERQWRKNVTKAMVKAYEEGRGTD